MDWERRFVLCSFAMREERAKPLLDLDLQLEVTPSLVLLVSDAPVPNSEEFEYSLQLSPQNETAISPNALESPWGPVQRERKL